MNRFVFFVAAIPIGGVFTALAFVKINGTPLMNYALYGITYVLNPKQYIFKKEERELQEIILSDEISEEIIVSEDKKQKPKDPKF